MSPDLVTALIGMVERLGFPVFVAGWFMWRLNGKLERLVEAMIRLSDVMAEHHAFAKQSRDDIALLLAAKK